MTELTDSLLAKEAMEMLGCDPGGEVLKIEFNADKNLFYMLIDYGIKGIKKYVTEMDRVVELAKAKHEAELAAAEEAKDESDVEDESEAEAPGTRPSPNYDKARVADLKAIAADMGISGLSGAKKADIISAIKAQKDEGEL